MTSIRRSRIKRYNPKRPRAPEFSRDEILETARNMFVKHAYDSVSIRKIAAQIGCAPGTMYLYFQDKAEIFDTLCQETFARLNERLMAIANDSDDPLACLRRGGRAYIEFALAHPSHYAVTFVSTRKIGSPDNDGNKNEKLLEAGLACFGSLRRIVSRAILQNQLRSADAEEVSQIIWAALHGLSALLMTHPSFPFVERTTLIEHHLDLIIEGVRRRG